MRQGGLLRFARIDDLKTAGWAKQSVRLMNVVMPGQKRVFALDVPGIHVFAELK
jgi:hypothetical protein